MKPFVVANILAPTDVSASSIPALRYGRLLADRFSARLTVMYTDPVVYAGDFVGPMNGFGYVMTTPEHQAELRKQLEKHAAPLMKGRQYALDVMAGQPIAAILEAARERHSDLIVMGTHLRHGWRRAILGSVSEGVLHGASVPVLTVATQDEVTGVRPYAITSIMCPVNFSEVAREALHVAARFADAFGAHLTIVHVIERDEVTDVKSDEERIRRWVSPELQEVCSYRELVVRGGPAERVLDCADDLGADFLVIGAQHKFFRDATVIGTTTERLIRFASCPVLVVPRDAVRHGETEPIDDELAVGVGT